MKFEKGSKVTFSFASGNPRTALPLIVEEVMDTESGVFYRLKGYAGSLFLASSLTSWSVAA